MGANAIEIYRNNTKSILCTVTGLADLDGYTCTLTAKAKKNDTTALITKVGSVDALVITFALSRDDTDINSDILHYDVVIVSSTKNYTIVQDTLRILQSVKF